MKTVRSDGRRFNISDYLYGHQRDSVGWNAINNDASVFSLTVGPISDTVYYFGLRVPEGKVYVLYNRELAVSEGVFRIDVCQDSGDFTTAGATKLTVHPINEASTPEFECEVWADVTPGGTVTEQEWGFVDTGTNLGDAKASGASGTEQLVKRFTGDSLLRISNAGAGTNNYTMSLRLIAWEEDA